MQLYQMWNRAICIRTRFSARDKWRVARKGNLMGEKAMDLWRFILPRDLPLVFVAKRRKKGWKISRRGGKGERKMSDGERKEIEWLKSML